MREERQHDVDGLIIVSNTSQLQPELFNVDFNALFAQGDYFDFGVDFRTQFFYAQPFAPPRIIALDNATRSLVPRAEIASALAGASAAFRSQVTAPVLLLQADHDENSFLSTTCPVLGLARRQLHVAASRRPQTLPAPRQCAGGRAHRPLAQRRLLSPAVHPSHTPWCL